LRPLAASSTSSAVPFLPFMPFVSRISTRLALVAGIACVID
jgi:hypothetical protein